MTEFASSGSRCALPVGVLAEVLQMTGRLAQIAGYLSLVGAPYRSGPVVICAVLAKPLPRGSVSACYCGLWKESLPAMAAVCEKPI